MKIVERKRWLFFGLPFTFTTYELTDDLLTIKEGFLNRKENSCYMYKITDVELKRSLVERIFGLGTIVCHTSDVTHSIIILKYIKHSQMVKDELLKITEDHRIRRRTVNMQNINADDVDFDVVD